LELAGIEKRGRPEHEFKYNGKELIEELGLNWNDYGARNYDAQLGRWHHIDPKAELYLGWSPYTYALNTPTNAIDPNGHLVIFINGNHFGNSGQGYWRNGNVHFDEMVQKQLGDNYKPRYYDGSGGGWHPLVPRTNERYDPSSRYERYQQNPGDFYSEPQGRYNGGYDQGKKDAKTIIDNLHRDKNNCIDETIKIVTHSMGGVYGKGFVKALKEYIKTLPLEQQKQIKITLVADLDPYQAGSYSADPDIKTIQFRVANFWNLSGMGWLANETEKGAEQGDVSKTKSDHSLFNFIQTISQLSEGTYKWDNKNKKWVKTN
jgi:RHS repeat-associated protein